METAHGRGRRGRRREVGGFPGPICVPGTVQSTFNISTLVCLGLDLTSRAWWPQSPYHHHVYFWLSRQSPSLWPQRSSKMAWILSSSGYPRTCLPISYGLSAHIPLPSSIIDILPILPQVSTRLFVHSSDIQQEQSPSLLCQRPHPTQYWSSPAPLRISRYYRIFPLPQLLLVNAGFLAL